jgi:hypothetical protein
LAFIVALAVAGIWLAVQIAGMRKKSGLRSFRPTQLRADRGQDARALMQSAPRERTIERH